MSKGKAQIVAGKFPRGQWACAMRQRPALAVRAQSQGLQGVSDRLHLCSRRDRNASIMEFQVRKIMDERTMTISSLMALHLHHPTSECP